MQLDEGSLTFNANPDEVSEPLLTVTNILKYLWLFFYSHRYIKRQSFSISSSIGMVNTKL